MSTTPGLVRALVVLVLLALGTGASVAVAGSCTVPSGSHPTIQAAVNAAGCDPILLGSQHYLESVVIARSLTLQGSSSATTTIEGQVEVQAGTVVVNALTVSTDTPALRGSFTGALLVSGNARVSGQDLVLLLGAQLFGEGSETGTTAAWSTTVP